MNEEQLEDLKRFVANTVGQTEGRLSQRFDELAKEMREGFEGVGDALDIHTKATDEELADHEKRITSLERAA